MVCAASPAGAASVLKSAQGFAVLGATSVADTGATTLTGDLGVGSAGIIRGAGSIALTGTTHAGDAIAAQAQADALQAFDLLSALGATQNLSGDDLGALGHALAPGVYDFSGSAGLTGDLTLDFASDPQGAFVFQIGTTLTTATSSTVTVLDGSAGSRIYWLVGTSATLGSGTSFVGNILAHTSITLNSGSTILYGRAIAISAAVTLNANSISDDGAAGDFGSLGFSGGPAASVPEPASWEILLAGSSLCGFALRRRFAAQARIDARPGSPGSSPAP